jgi:hypothetical protein
MFGCFGSATLFKSQKIVGESDLPRFFYGITGLSCGSEEKFTAEAAFESRRRWKRKSRLRSSPGLRRVVEAAGALAKRHDVR